MASALNPEVWNFYVVQHGDTVSRIFQRVYGISNQEFQSFLGAIAANNPHIKDLNRIQPGQVLDIGLYCAARSLNHAADMMELERVYGSLSTNEKRQVHENPHVLNTVLGWIGTLAVNVPDAGFMTIENLVKQYATSVEKYGAELAKSYASGDRGTLKTELMNKVLNKRPVQDALSKIPKFVQGQILKNGKKLATPFTFKEMGLAKETKALLKLSPKSISTYNPFSGVLKEYSRVARFAKYGGGVTTWVIPTTVGIYDSYQAYGTDKFGVTVAKSTGSVLGGAVGTASGYFLCSLVFAVPTGGTSVFWCGIAAGALGGIAFGAGGSVIGEKLYEGFTAAGSTGGVGTVVDPTFILQAQQCAIPEMGR